MTQYKELATYYRGFYQFLNVSAEELTPVTSSRVTKAREKLGKLTLVQFYDLSTDVYDELQRRINETHEQPKHLLPKANYHPKRNQAREKLAALPSSRFKDLVNDVYVEIEKRDPSIKRSMQKPAHLTLDSRAATEAYSNSTSKRSTSQSQQTQKTPTDETQNLKPPATDSPSQREIKSATVVPQKAELTWSSDDEEYDERDESKPKQLRAIDTPKSDYSPVKLGNLAVTSTAEPESKNLNSPTSKSILSAPAGTSNHNSPVKKFVHTHNKSTSSQLSSNRLSSYRDKDKDIQLLIEESQKMDAKITSLEVELNTISQQNNELQSQKDSLQSENEGLKYEVQQMSDISKELTRLRGENLKLLEKTNNHDSNMQSLQEDSDKLVELEHKYDTLQDKYLDDTQRMMKGNEQLSSELEALMKDFNDLKEINENKTNEIARLQQDGHERFAESRSINKNSDKELLNVTYAHDQLKGEVDQLKGECDKLRATHDELSNDHRKVQKSYGNLKEEYSGLQSTHTELIQEHMKLKDDNIKLKDQIFKLKDLQDSLKNENEMLKDSVEALKDNQRNLKDNHISLKAETIERSFDINNMNNNNYLESSTSLDGNIGAIPRNGFEPAFSTIGGATTVMSLNSVSIADSTQNEKELSIWQGRFEKARSDQVFRHLTGTIPNDPNYNAYASPSGLVSTSTVSEFYAAVETFLMYINDDTIVSTKVLFERIAAVIFAAKEIGRQAYPEEKVEDGNGNVNMRKLHSAVSSALSNTRYYAATSGVIPKLLLNVSISDVYANVVDILRDVKVSSRENSNRNSASSMRNYNYNTSRDGDIAANELRKSINNFSANKSHAVPPISIPKTSAFNDDVASVRPLRITQRLTNQEDNTSFKTPKPPALSKATRRPISPIVVSIPGAHSNPHSHNQSNDQYPTEFSRREREPSIVSVTPSKATSMFKESNVSVSSLASKFSSESPSPTTPTKSVATMNGVPKRLSSSPQANVLARLKQLETSRDSGTVSRSASSSPIPRKLNSTSRAYEMFEPRNGSASLSSKEVESINSNIKGKRQSISPLEEAILLNAQQQQKDEEEQLKLKQKNQEEQESLKSTSFNDQVSISTANNKSIVNSHYSNGTAKVSNAQSSGTPKQSGQAANTGKLASFDNQYSTPTKQAGSKSSMRSDSPASQRQAQSSSSVSNTVSDNSPMIKRQVSHSSRPTGGSSNNSSSGIQKVSPDHQRQLSSSSRPSSAAFADDSSLQSSPIQQRQVSALKSAVKNIQVEEPSAPQGSPPEQHQLFDSSRPNSSAFADNSGLQSSPIQQRQVSAPKSAVKNIVVETPPESPQKQQQPQQHSSPGKAATPAQQTEQQPAVPAASSASVPQIAVDKNTSDEFKAVDDSPSYDTPPPKQFNSQPQSTAQTPVKYQPNNNSLPSSAQVPNSRAASGPSTAPVSQQTNSAPGSRSLQPPSVTESRPVTATTSGLPSAGSALSYDLDSQKEIEEQYILENFNTLNPDNTLRELLVYLEHQTMQVISAIQLLLESIRDPKATKGLLRSGANEIIEVVKQMAQGTTTLMNQSRYVESMGHAKYVVDILEDCYSRMESLYNANDGKKDQDYAEKSFKQRSAGIAFDVARSTKELVKTVEEASLRDEIAVIDSRLNPGGSSMQ